MSTDWQKLNKIMQDVALKELHPFNAADIVINIYEPQKKAIDKAIAEIQKPHRIIMNGKSNSEYYELVAKYCLNLIDKIEMLLKKGKV